jgi:hypothetical protein
MPHMHDAWRVRHPYRRAYTYVRADCASRIDRVYVSAGLLPQVMACRHEDRAPAVGDHTPVMVQLRPRDPGALGPGLPRVRLAFLADEQGRGDMRDWLAAQQPPPATDALAVVQDWWPAFKSGLLEKVQQLNSQARQRRALRPQAAGRAAAASAVRAAHDLLGACAGAAVPSALASVVAARAGLAQLQDAEGARQRQRRRQQWVHQGERPGPAMSRVLRPPRAASYIAGLRAPGSGRLVTHGLGMAAIIGRAFAATAAAPCVLPAARAEVLQAVQQHSQRLGDERAAALGQAAVTEEEVAAAIAATAPGKASGLDGIPGELFRHYRLQLAPILAALYSAMGTAQRVPPGFLDGVILPIAKPGGDPADPAAYRPIQLLNYDYRLLAKVLANRLLAVAGGVIHPAQSAFLRGRHIGDSIRLLQALAALLSAEQRSAVVAFLDFQKAYDTVDRGLLFEVADALGLGGEFVAWMRLVLTGTYTCACVNGFRSGFYPCAAGVRQGCPLAPLLYLLAGQALYCFFVQRGVGVAAGGAVVAAAQYADDTEACLPSLAAVPPFLACMHTFADASGQRLNLGKSQLLPIGLQPPPQPLQQAAASSGGGGGVGASLLAVVSQAKSLGITFTSSGKGTVDWEARLVAVRRRLQAISRVPHLSAFGRAFAVNAYALSTLLYAAQFGGPVPTAVTDSLQRMSAALVDADLGPDGSLRRPPGVPADCMCAHPRDGGMGLLPLRENVWARWACEAATLLTGDARVPWVATYTALCQRLCVGSLGVLAPSVGAWWLLVCHDGWLAPPAGAPALPGALRLLVLGLRALPPLSFVGEPALPAPGEWCWHVPLWANPLLVVEQQCVVPALGGSRRLVVGLECMAAPGLVGQPRLRCVGEAVSLLAALERIECMHGGLAAKRQAYTAVWRDAFEPPDGGRLGPAQYRVDWNLLLEHVRRLVGFVPPAWVAAVRACLAAPPLVTDASVAAARARLCAGLGWRLPAGRPGQPGRVVLLADLTVKAATRLQQLPAHAAIAVRHAACQERVRALDVLLPAAPLPAVRQVVARWWRLRVANSYKESAWRLLLNAFPVAARMGGLAAASACVACAVPGPDVGHHFWLCPVARVVCSEVEGQLAACGMLPAGQGLPCAAVWLAQKPHPDIMQLVWDMVCLAAVHAMERGRRAAWAVAAGGLPAGPAVAAVATRAARGGLWDVLADFAATARVRPPAEGAAVQSFARQPCIVWVAAPAGGGPGRLQVVRR